MWRGEVEVIHHLVHIIRFHWKDIGTVGRIYMNLRVLNVMSNGFIILSNVFPFGCGEDKNWIIQNQEKIIQTCQTHW